jgi:redox-sensitive bicupin YhaK (pirin superfamily)
MQVPDSIEAVIVPRARDLGGFEVRRALPSRTRQMVGPFIFLDHMGQPRVQRRPRY